MSEKAIIYLHGFNSASLGLDGALLISKSKLQCLHVFCEQNGIRLIAPNVDYRDFESMIEDLMFERNHLLDSGFDVIWMGSSMGGFASWYLSIKTGSKAVLINPAIEPSQLLRQFIGVEHNYETGQPYSWQQSDCDQFNQFEREIELSNAPLDITVLVDSGDELIDSANTIRTFQRCAEVIVFNGGSHAFEHMAESIPIIRSVIFSNS
jgi:uncharacterized protein